MADIVGKGRARFCSHQHPPPSTTECDSICRKSPQRRNLAHSIAIDCLYVAIGVSLFCGLVRTQNPPGFASGVRPPPSTKISFLGMNSLQKNKASPRGFFGLEKRWCRFWRPIVADLLLSISEEPSPSFLVIISDRFVANSLRRFVDQAQRTGWLWRVAYESPLRI
jgi:hypothetical protein